MSTICPNAPKIPQSPIQIHPSATSLSENSSVLCTTSSPKFHQTYSIYETLIPKGHMPLCQVAKALQGSIMKTATKGTTNIVKIIDKSLYLKQVTIYNNQEMKVDEDIIKEMKILKYLNSNHPPSALTKFIDFFDDSYNYFLIMEDAGGSFFDFVVKCHEFLDRGLMDISLWHSFCKIAMQQMVHLLEWMHNTMHCCHLDISLENFVIKNIKVSMDKYTKKIINFNADFQIKLIDFGLAEVFSDRNQFGMIDFGCNKYVGKRGYKAPEVYRERKAFDARSADCWSLGVCFFIMIIGSPPFRRASKRDPRYVIIMNGEYTHLLSSWNKIHYVTVNMLSLMRKIFIKEKYRLNIKQIQQHSYFKNV